MDNNMVGGTLEAPCPKEKITGDQRDPLNHVQNVDKVIGDLRIRGPG